MFSQAGLLFSVLFLLSYGQLVRGGGGDRWGGRRGEYNLILERKTSYEDREDGSGCAEDDISIFKYVNDDEDIHESSGSFLTDTDWSPPVFEDSKEVSNNNANNEATEDPFNINERDIKKESDDSQSTSLKNKKPPENVIEKNPSEHEVDDLYFYI